MKSVKLQLLVTLVALLDASWFFVVKGLPPNKTFAEALQKSDLTELRRLVNWREAALEMSCRIGQSFARWL
jgi:hypothetical protein